MEPRGRKKPRTPRPNPIPIRFKNHETILNKIGARKTTPDFNQKLPGKRPPRQNLHRSTPKRKKHNRFSRNFNHDGHIRRRRKPTRRRVPTTRPTKQNQIRPIHGRRHVGFQNLHSLQQRGVVHVVGRRDRSDQRGSIPTEAANYGGGGGAEGDVGGDVIYGDGVRGGDLGIDAAQ